MEASQLQRQRVRVQRALISRLLFISFVMICGACSSAPPRKLPPEPPRMVPAGVFLEEPLRSYQVVGTVRSWREFPASLNDFNDTLMMKRLCQQAFYDASEKLLKIAHENGGEAVMKVQSVVFLADGRKEFYSRPECSEDGAEGEVLVQGTAIRWGGVGKDSGSPPKTAIKKSVP